MMRRIFSNKEVVLGVTGSIAAYKACELASRLTEYGARVTCALTDSAMELVGAATFEALTGRRAISRMFEPLQNPEIEHIAVAKRADLFLIAPATANILAKAANGIADDWLSTTLLATRAPILFAPAMNANMYAHAATQDNMALLRERGNHFVGPEPGRLACGDEGLGRMADPQKILEAALPLVSNRHDLAKKRVLLTSGGNREPIDPVRFIGNRSSGKMGRALAIEALARGAQVTAVCGPSEIAMPYGVEVIPVETAAQMAEAVNAHVDSADIIIGAAAVADYRVEHIADDKIKKTGKGLTLKLVENPDILGGVAKAKRPEQVVVGFAAETYDHAEHAAEKLQKKHLDLIVAVEVNTPESGFGLETLRVCFLASNGRSVDWALASKHEVASRIFDWILEASD